MQLKEVLSTAQDAIAVRRVFAEPYEKDGITLIAAARIGGGVGGGGGHDETGQEGEGGGFGMGGRPAGAYVIEDGSVRWMPAVDPARMLTVLGAVVVAVVLSRARVETTRALAAGAGPRHRSRRRRRRAHVR
ncbi:hypothetical protein OF117_02155 [Geodermatophilus sp. YIM 151500]|uniref:spore germination protein GerW family protein n=1 Tax=Geodermatophilus sp. YIM 151500 TaxID=2984531 RepID=UPI0021E38571|nr:spore germination protein GerW family protein [Geodermatophilus sp. YIM 151500]MCV2488155.1 hypothetical protein [Geodermatophilus sp. YIM 151500]